MCNTRINVIILALLTEQKLISKITPIVSNPIVNKVYLIRKHPLPCDKVICYSPPSYIRRSALLTELYRILTLFYLCVTKKIHVIMGIHFEMHGIYAGIAGIFFRIPVVQNLIGNEFARALTNRFSLSLMRKASAIVVRGESTRKDMVNHGINMSNIFCAPNAFDFSKVPLPTVRKKKYDVIFVGSLVEVKRIDILLKALQMVRYVYNYENLRVAIIGGGPLRYDLSRLTEELSLENSVEFLGCLNDIYPVMSHSRVFVMTSDTEGLPMAMIEALASGLPCVLPNVGNIPTVAVHNHNALLVTNGNICEFAKSIYTLLSDAHLYNTLSKNALSIRKEKQDQYSVNSIRLIWERIFSRLPAISMCRRI